MITDYTTQPIQSSVLIFPKDNDSFYRPVLLKHTGFAYDGYKYNAGVKDVNTTASWFAETPGTYRSETAAFPPSALVLLSPVALFILDETHESLPMWMTFILSDSFALGNNFNGSLIGFSPFDLAYSNGILSVSYKPDPGSSVQSIMVVSIDFIKDSVYLDVGLLPPPQPELIQNGGFESGNLTYWTQFGDTSFTGVGIAGDPSPNVSGRQPHRGTYLASIGPTTPGGFFQAVATNAGDAYTIVFWLATFGEFPNTFKAEFDGVTLLEFTNSPPFDWTKFTFVRTATTSVTQLKFTASSELDYYDIDDVSVRKT